MNYTLMHKNIPVLYSKVQRLDLAYFLQEQGLMQPKKLHESLHYQVQQKRAEV